MPSDREKLEGETLSELADRLQPGPASTHQFNVANAELMRRQAIWQQEASDAQKRAVIEQKRAADAAVETAKATRRSARYMLASVIVLASHPCSLWQSTSWRYARTNSCAAKAPATSRYSPQSFSPHPC
jgi:hypothetical protein